jgi:hypothetical protein
MKNQKLNKLTVHAEDAIVLDHLVYNMSPNC